MRAPTHVVFIKYNDENIKKKKTAEIFCTLCYRLQMFITIIINESSVNK